jgi:hypothetical protein
MPSPDESGHGWAAARTTYLEMETRNMRIRGIPAVCLVIGALGAASAAMAKDEGLYVGGSVGSVSFEEDISDLEDIEFDENDFAFKIFAGYQFNEVFAIEGGYVDFGSPSNDDISVDSYGLDAFGVFGIPIGPIRGFAKAGGVWWDSDIDAFDFDESDDGVDLAAGLGLEIELGSFGVRGEVEYFDFASNVWMYTVGATLTF